MKQFSRKIPPLHRPFCHPEADADTALSGVEADAEGSMHLLLLGWSFVTVPHSMSSRANEKAATAATRYNPCKHWGKP